MRYEYLISFYTTVKLGSFTAAARELHLTQPAVSMAIKQLEFEYEQNLLDRKPGGKFQLTPIGEQIYGIAENIYTQMKNLENIKQKNLKNEIIIECNTIAGIYLITSLTCKYQNNRQVSFNIRVTRDPMQNMLDGKCDLVMLLVSNSKNNNESNLKVLKTWEDKHEIIVSEFNSLAKHCATKQDLSQLDYVLAPKGTAYRSLLDETLHIQLGNSLKCTVELNNPEAVKQSILYLNKPGILVRSVVLNEINKMTLLPVANDLDLRCKHILGIKKYSSQSNTVRNFTKYLTDIS